MPEPGFQHKMGGIGSFNPFDEEKPVITQYTAAEIATLQSKLDQQLGPEFIASRPGAGGLKVHYLPADKAINLANEVFGFNGWSSSIRNISIDFVDEAKDTGKISLGLSVIVRVTLKDGTYHEDIGYGQIENCKGKAAAFEKAKKEGTTDALKRALRNFGNVLGNCVYDKTYVKEVTKIRVPATRFNPQKLHRHPDIVPPRSAGPPQTNQSSTAGVKPEVKAEINESTISFDEYGGDEFDDEFGIFGEGEHSVIEGIMPDEVAIESSHPTPTNTTAPAQGITNANQNIRAGGAGGAIVNAGRNLSDSPSLNRRASINQNQQGNPQTPISKQNPQILRQQRPQAIQQNTANGIPPPPQRQVSKSNSNQPSRQYAGQGLQSNTVPTLPTPQLNAQQALSNQQSPPVGFFSARAAESLQGDGKAPESALFNPHMQTSIPRSLGIDHSKSSPIPKKLFGNQGGVNQSLPNPPQRPDLGAAGGFNPGRQIGMPPPAGGPQHNRTPYKPPSIVQGAGGVKRPADNANLAQNTYRPALGDASNAQLNAQGPQGQAQGQSQFIGNDPKRLRS